MVKYKLKKVYFYIYIGRTFTSIPPVLFLTLKRYQFKKYHTRPIKIMANLHYPKTINLGFLYDTPTG